MKDNLSVSKYGLRHKTTGKMMGYYTVNNDNDCCVGASYNLFPVDDITKEPLWLVDNIKTATRVASYSEKWYNADYDTPQNSYVGQLDVVPVMILIGLPK